MQNHVYITHPVVDSYAREAGGWIASASGQIEQPRQGGNHMAQSDIFCSNINGLQKF